MSIWVNILEGGLNIPVGNRFSRRFLYWLGRLISNMRPGVSIDKSALIHPEARICARGQRIVIGRRCAVARGAAIQGGVNVGMNCTVQCNTNVVGYAGGEVNIGNGVHIAGNCMIIGANHRHDPGKPIHTQGVDPQPITIEDDVWIAGGVNILAGIRIGTGSIIGAGAVVTKDIPPLSIAAGVPARVIKKRA